MAATTRPPILLNRRPSTRKTCTLEEVELRFWRTMLGLRSGEEMTWTTLATDMPYRYSQNCWSRKVSPEDELVEAGRHDSPEAAQDDPDGGWDEYQPG